MAGTEEELERQFAALPALAQRGRRKEWTPLEDQKILKYWPTANHAAMAKLLKVAESTLRKRHEYLSYGGSHA